GTDDAGAPGRLATPGTQNGAPADAGDSAAAAAPGAGSDDAVTAREQGVSPGAIAADATGDATADNAARSVPPAAAGGGLALALLLALAGGVLLNVMPCVLPILSLKVLGLAQGGGSRASARKHALWYTAGVLVAFAFIGLAVLALRAAGLAMGWGFQLQQPGFVAALVLLMAAVGLSLSG